MKTILFALITWIGICGAFFGLMILLGKHLEKRRQRKIREIARENVIEDIIDKVLEYVKCEHEIDQDEDGVHHSYEYDVKEGCADALQKMLEERIR